MTSVVVDQDCKDNVGNLPVTPSTRFVDDCMEMQGRSLAVLNQFLFFLQATGQVMKGIEGDGIPKGIENRWESLRDFLLVQMQSIEDLSASSTNLMVMLLLERRYLALNNVAKLSDREKKALKYLEPRDCEGRLFGGKLTPFWNVRSQLKSALVTEAFVASMSKRKRDRSASPDKSRNRYKQQKGQKKDDQGNKSGKGSSNNNNNNNNKRKGKNAANKQSFRSTYPTGGGANAKSSDKDKKF
jgi:hypothetical protein